MDSEKIYVMLSNIYIYIYIDLDQQMVSSSMIRPNLNGAESLVMTLFALFASSAGLIPSLQICLHPLGKKQPAIKPQKVCQKHLWLTRFKNQR